MLKTIPEICRELEGRNIKVSPPTIQNYLKQFGIEGKDYLMIPKKKNVSWKITNYGYNLILNKLGY